MSLMTLNKHRKKVEEAAIYEDLRLKFHRQLGRELRYARKVLGFTQQEYAKLLNIEQSALSRVESGDQRLDAAQAVLVSTTLAQAKEYAAGAAGAELERIERLRWKVYG